MVLECFASERHSGLGERRSHDYRLTGLQDYWGCSYVSSERNISPRLFPNNQSYG
jgi:hypothetical protein